MSALRPLPPRPSLEFDRKQAKQLLRHIRAGTAPAIDRALARHAQLDVRSLATFTLADAQLVVAREYGFTSWVRLVQYHNNLARQRDNAQSIHSLDVYTNSVSRLLADHRRGRSPAARGLAAYVPKFYGMRLDEVLAAEVSIEDAQLAVARSNGCPSWLV